MKVLVTGATGFVGKEVVRELRHRRVRVRVVNRTEAGSSEDIEIVTVKAIDADTDWGRTLEGIDVVLHLAARVHVMKECSANPLDEFRAVNVGGTEHFARCAVAAGVKRMVYVSSVKVNGEETECSRVYTEQDRAYPRDPYGISKWEAEQVLHRVATETGLEVVVVRPPLVYGAGVKGNFIQMIKVLSQGFPLPLASINNRRSLVYVGNLVDALITCASHPAAAGQTYLVSDGEDISTPDLLRRLGAELGRQAHLFPCPVGLLRLAGKITGKADQVQRLLGSLQVDSGKIRRELNGIPPFSMQQGLHATAEWYRNTHP